MGPGTIANVRFTSSVPEPMQISSTSLKSPRHLPDGLLTDASASRISCASMHTFYGPSISGLLRIRLPIPKFGQLYSHILRRSS